MRRIANLLALSGAAVALIALVSARMMQFYWNSELDNALLNAPMSAILIIAMILVLLGTFLAVLSREVRFPRKIMMILLNLFVLGFWFGVISKSRSPAELCQYYH